MMISTAIKLDQPILLELAMSYGNSEDSKVNSHNFFRTLSKYFQLDIAVCWQKENSNYKFCTLIDTYPKSIKCSLMQNSIFKNELQKNDFTIANQNQHLGKELLELIHYEKGNVLVFNTPAMFIYLFRKKISFTQKEGIFLKDQIIRFSNFLSLELQRNTLTKKVTAYEIKEKSFLQTQQQSQKDQQFVKDELIKTQSRLSTMYKNMEDGIFLYNYISEKITDFNDSAFKAFGYDKREDLLGMSRFKFTPQFSKFFPKIDIHEYTKGHGIKVCNGESIHKTLGIFVGKDNREFLVEANVVPTHQEKGEAFIIFKDTTARILAQKKVKQREQRYRQIFENSHEAIIYFDIKKQKIVDCNNQALMLFGINNKKRFFETSFEDFYSSEETEITAFDFFQKQMKISIEKGSANFTFLAKTLNNDTFWAEGNVVVEMGSKWPRKLVFFIRDITEKYNTRQELQLQHEKLKKYIESNMQLENFAYVASHDLKTPLSTIINFTQLLSRNLKGKLNESEKEYFSFITKASKNMQDLIQDLLNYSHVNNTQNNLRKINVVDLLNEIKEALQFNLQKDNAVIDFPTLPFFIQADHFKLKQLFQNLLTNALKFKKADTNPIIKITFKENKTHWFFSIQDNGIGIEAQYKEKIFLLFKRLHGNDTYEGTGIGLAMCKKIVEQHQGEIGLESTPEEGTTFHFSIKKQKENIDSSVV